MSEKRKTAELLMPAGNLRRLKTAICYGADAVYAGTPDLSLRTQSNFSLSDLKKGIEFAHERNKRVYLTLNLFAHNRDIAKLPAFVETLKELQPDGIIIADPGVFAFVRAEMPEIDLHISTQANVNSWLTVQFWENLGASLVVLAREVSFAELLEIRAKCPNIRLESFIHGSICMTYSGRCLLSNFMAERGANQGGCAHSCRWKYKMHVRLKNGKTLEINDENQEQFDFLLEEELRPGELMQIEEDQHGSYILNAKDLCLMPKLPDFLRNGVDSLKVEGRNKGPFYAATVARAYRAAIDDWYADPENWSPKHYLKELALVSHRGYTHGFHDGRLTNLSHDYDEAYSASRWQFSGFVREWDEDHMIFELKNYLRAGDVIEFLLPQSKKLENIRLRLHSFTDSVTRAVTEKVSAGQNKAILIPISAFDREDPGTLKQKLPPLTVARREAPHSRLTPHIKKRDLAFKVEQEELDDEEYKKRVSKIPETEKKTKKKKTKNASVCCGRGCNGCLRFWLDDEYASAREALKEKGLGGRLPSGWKADD